MPDLLRELREELPRLASRAAQDALQRAIPALPAAPQPASEKSASPPHVHFKDRLASEKLSPPPQVHFKDRPVSEKLASPPQGGKAPSKAAYAVLRGESEFYELPKLHTSVGRGNECDICIATSQSVSH